MIRSLAGLDDGNRTAELLNLGGKALSWLNRMMGPKEEL